MTEQKADKKSAEKNYGNISMTKEQPAFVPSADQEPPEKTSNPHLITLCAYTEPLE
jgi:hypothetical protein